MEKVNAIVQSQGKLLRLSGSIGSEAGVLSMGSGSGIDHLSIVATRPMSTVMNEKRTFGRLPLLCVCKFPR